MTPALERKCFTDRAGPPRRAVMRSPGRHVRTVNGPSVGSVADQVSSSASRRARDESASRPSRLPWRGIACAGESASCRRPKLERVTRAHDLPAARELNPRADARRRRELNEPSNSATVERRAGASGDRRPDDTRARSLNVERATQRATSSPDASVDRSHIEAVIDVRVHIVTPASRLARDGQQLRDRSSGEHDAARAADRVAHGFSRSAETCSSDPRPTRSGARPRTRRISRRHTSISGRTIAVRA